MQVVAYKTSKIQPKDNLYKILDDYLPKLEEKSIVVVTSKIVSLCEGSVLKDDGSISKEKLVHKEADYYLGDDYPTAYGHIITLKNNILILSAGIDESNTGGYFVLWPKNVQKTANEIWQYLKDKYALSHVGVIITDSHTVPLRWGIIGTGLAWCGFQQSNSYVGKPDVFGRPLQSSFGSMIEGLSAAAVAVMGEGAEQTPLAVINDIPFVTFQDHEPTSAELKAMQIDRKDDIYGPLLNSVKWEKGG
ncbi:MAG TPA: coenzyme F420-0:L-glutamate ligase [Candidatus Saccharimonadales bacterium]|nr:coenzyme F420-0:L-glutamate ligase [Candidatus Saccharimonadales bacterium]